MKKKFFQKLKLILGCFFLSFFFNVSTIKAIEKKSENEIIIIQCPEIPRKFTKEVNKDDEIKKPKPRKIGGILTGTTSEKYQKSSFLWINEYGKKNNLILPKIRSTHNISKITSINTNYHLKKEDDKKIKKFKELFYLEIKQIIITDYNNSKNKK